VSTSFRSRLRIDEHVVDGPSSAHDLQVANAGLHVVVQRRASPDQRGENEKREAELKSETARLESTSQADSIRTVEEARVAAERERMEIYSGLEPEVLMGLAAREFARKLQKIEHLNVTPDMLGQLLTDLVKNGKAAKSVRGQG